METTITPISKGERKLVHIMQDSDVTFFVNGDINYNLDTLHLKYAEKYAHEMLTITYSDADGHEMSYGKTLMNGGVMNWVNDEPIAHSNFGAISFSSRKELILDFSFS
jgi:hypothetical protein